MGHVYANLASFKRFLSGAEYGDDRDPELLAVLESASRAVDGYCKRGSGFGPVIETRSFTSRGSTLRLEADLADLVGVTVNGTALDLDDVTVLDRRRLSGPFGWRRTVAVTGAWSYPVEVVATGTAVADDPLSDAAATLTVADATPLSVGQTLLIEDEQLLVTAIVDTTVTVVRGANGTTAAEHAETTPISAYRYAAEAVETTMRVGQRRWKARDAGLTASFDGAGMPMTDHRDSEVSILRAGLGHLRFGIVG